MAYRKDLKKRIAHTDGSACVWCRAELEKDQTTMDHVIPDSLGGPLASYNLVPACGPCNSRRGNVSALEWLRVCQAAGYEPDANAIGRALQMALDIGHVGCGYSLYYVARQLAAPEFMG